MKSVEKVDQFPSVEVYTFTYNESFYIEHFVKWYSARFRNLSIIIFDNHSSDDTVAKAKELGCQVQFWGGLDSKSELEFIQLKNNCFKKGKADYFIVCDIDELLDIDDYALFKNSPLMVKGIGYNMVGYVNQEFEKINMGSRDRYYDKTTLFRRDRLLEINYSLGAHTCNPKFEEGFDQNQIIFRNLYHFRWISLNFVKERYERNRNRVVETERLKGIDAHYFTSLELLEKEYLSAKQDAVTLPIKWT